MWEKAYTAGLRGKINEEERYFWSMAIISTVLAAVIESCFNQ
jgi:hypothetical protein